MFSSLMSPVANLGSVQVAEGRNELAKDALDFVDCEVVVVAVVEEVATVDQLHHNRLVISGLHEIEDLDNERVVNFGKDRDFFAVVVQYVRVCQVGFRIDLHRQIHTASDMTDLEHFCVRSGANLRLDQIWANVVCS